MDILYVLIPIAAILLIVAIIAFVWAVNNKQFDDLERKGKDIILDDGQEKLNRHSTTPQDR